jgi:hypothetical protein
VAAPSEAVPPAAISSRLHAEQLARRLLGSMGSSTVRSLIIDLDGPHGTVVYCSGREPIAVWRLEMGDLAPLARRCDEGNRVALRALKEKAAHLVSRVRLGVVAGSVEEVLLVYECHRPHARFLGRALIEAVLTRSASTISRSNPSTPATELAA